MLSSVFIRKKEPHSISSRTKCILRPERILWAGVHKTHRFIPEHKKNNYKVAIIPPEVGYMAHFKAKKIKTPECDLQKGKEVEINRDLQKYGKMIESKVNEVMTDLTKIAKTNTSQ